MSKPDIAAIIAAAKKSEQERIIKLLEGQKKIFSSPQYSTTGGYAEQFALNQAIALIKGENK